MCSTGILTNVVQTPTGWTRDCNGQFSGGNQTSCSLQTSYCGDGVNGTGIGYGGTEQCDDSNLTDNDGCSSTCQIEIPEVLLTVNTGNIVEAG